MSLGGTISSITRVNYRSRSRVINKRVVQSKKLQTVQLIIHENTITRTKMKNNIDAPCHPWLWGPRMSRTSYDNQLSQENPKLCVLSCVCAFCLPGPSRDFQCRGDDGIKFNLESTFNFNSVGSLSQSRKNCAGNATEDSRATSHNCVKHFLVAIYKTSDRI